MEKKWKTPELQVFTLDEVAEAISLNARSGGSSCAACWGGGGCTFDYSCGSFLA